MGKTSYKSPANLIEKCEQCAFLCGDLNQDQWSKICVDHGVSVEPVNPLWSWIHRFFWCTMIQTGLGSLILIQITPKERTLRLLRASKILELLVQRAYKNLIYYIHTEIYTLKSRRVNFRSQTDVNQSNVAYRFPHMWEKRYVQSGAAYHVFSRVSRTESWSFHSRLVDVVSYTAQDIAFRVWREQMVFIGILFERRLKRIRIEESDSN